MPTRSSQRKLTTAAVALLLGAMIAATPASADCVYAEVWTKQGTQARQYHLGPKECVRQTPFPPTFNTGAEREVVGVAGAGAWVWIPAP